MKTKEIKGITCCWCNEYGGNGNDANECFSFD